MLPGVVFPQASGERSDVADSIYAALLTELLVSLSFIEARSSH